MHSADHLKLQQALREASARYDFVLVPGRFNSGADHWQSIWERSLPIWQRVEQRNWNDPDTDRLRGSLGRLLAQCKRPALLVGHSLGALACVCLATEMRSRVAGVMLVAPAEPAKFHAEELVPMAALSQPSILVASHTDPFLDFRAPSIGRAFGAASWLTWVRQVISTLIQALAAGVMGWRCCAA
jgi:predicted alpha/beta hydrolase family esterase